MPAREELSAANNAFVILDATHTLSFVRPENESDVIPIQQSLDLDAARMDASLADAIRTPTRKTGSTSLSACLVSAKRSRARGRTVLLPRTSNAIAAWTPRSSPAELGNFRPAHPSVAAVILGE